MTVKELKEFLKNKPDNAECYFSVWMGGNRYGERRFRTQLSSPENTLSPSGKYLRITWVDDCQADHILENEFNS